MNILEAIADETLFARWFRDKATWQAWFAFVAALFGLPLTPDQLAVYRRATGRTEAPASAFSEAWLICGRRAGKSFVLALIAVFLACFRDYRPFLAPGERATVLVIATDRRQARVILRYVTAFLTMVPMLSRMIERETQDGFDLTNSVTIEVGTASAKTTRGYTFAAVLCDELAFWSTDTDAAEPDYAILDAIRPGMATVPGAMLLCASSPYARRGALWDAWRRWYGKNDAPALVWKAATREMNPTVPQRIIDEAMERDPASASAEYGAEFRSDVEAFVSREAVQACVSPGVFERAPISTQRYSAFVDPAGGAGGDSMTLAIAHKEKEIAVLDAVREVKPPFSPRATVAEFAVLLKRYRISYVTGDRWGGDWPAEAFREHGIIYRTSELSKSQIYGNALAEINSGKLDLLDHARLIAQLVSLERKTARGGKDSIDHPPGAHDDVCNAAVGALVNLVSVQKSFAGIWTDELTRPQPRDEFAPRFEWRERSDGLPGRVLVPVKGFDLESQPRATETHSMGERRAARIF